jgi:hypothetical protein
MLTTLPHDIIGLIWEHSIGQKYTLTRFPLVCKEFYKVTHTRSIFNFLDDKLYESASEAVKKHYKINCDAVLAMTKTADEELWGQLFVFFMGHSIFLEHYLKVFEHLVPSKDFPHSVNCQIMSVMRRICKVENMTVISTLMHAMSVLKGSKHVVQFLKRAVNWFREIDGEPALNLSDEEEWQEYAAYLGEL